MSIQGSVSVTLSETKEALIYFGSDLFYNEKLMDGVRNSMSENNGLSRMSDLLDSKVQSIRDFTSD